MNSPERLIEKFAKRECQDINVTYKVVSGKPEDSIVATVSCIYHGKNITAKGEGKNNYVAAAAAFKVLEGQVKLVKGKDSPKGKRKPIAKAADVQVVDDEISR